MTPEQLAAFQLVQSQVTQLGALMYQHKHTGADFTQKISSGSGIGDMEESTYDPAGIAQQLVGISATQTLTNKTLTSPTINGGTIISATIEDGTVEAAVLKSNIQATVATSAASGTETFDLSTGNVQNFTFSGSSSADSITFALSNVTINQIFIISVTQNSGGSGLVTWFTTIRWTGGGGAPTLTTTGGARDTFGFICTSTGTFDGFVIGQNI